MQDIQACISRMFHLCNLNYAQTTLKCQRLFALSRKGPAKFRKENCHNKKHSAKVAVSQHPGAGEKIISTIFIALPMLEIILHTHTHTSMQSNCNVCLVARGISFQHPLWISWPKYDIKACSKHFLNIFFFPLSSSSKVWCLFPVRWAKWWRPPWRTPIASAVTRRRKSYWTLRLQLTSRND